jgi:hypothetical protein
MKDPHENNVDILGREWILVQGGRNIIDKCQIKIWESQSQLRGVGALLKNMGECELSPDELYGVGVVLERISKRLCKISDKLSTSIAEKTQNQE